MYFFKHQGEIVSTIAIGIASMDTSRVLICRIARE